MILSYLITFLRSFNFLSSKGIDHSFYGQNHKYLHEKIVIFTHTRQETLIDPSAAENCKKFYLSEQNKK